MSEIEKMYENVGVLKECLSPCYINKTWRKAHDCPNCDNRENYPLFTAEKQLELIKFLFNQGVYYSTFANNTYQFHISDEIENPQPRKFDVAIAEIINDLWQDLTEEEK